MEEMNNTDPMGNMANMTNMTDMMNMTMHNMTMNNTTGGHSNNLTDHSNNNNMTDHSNNMTGHSGGHSGHESSSNSATGNNGNSFCTAGMLGHGGAGTDGMIMYMDGFRFSLKGDQPCLNLYFPGWTLDSRGKFAGAMVGIFCMGVMTEGIARWRFLSNKRLKGSPRKRLFVTFLHTLQALVGYILMLATMTFSVELLIMVVLGLGVGYAVFYDDCDHHVTTNPCCNFMQNEADERHLAFPSKSTSFNEDNSDDAKEESAVVNVAVLSDDLEEDDEEEA